MADLYINTDTGALLFFYLVDAVDGLTAETGEAGGQPQISLDGAAFSTTGVSTLTALGSGHYYCTVNLVTAGATAGQFIVGRYKSANTAEAPTLNEIHVVSYDPAESLKAQLGGTGFVSSTHSLVALYNLIVGTGLVAAANNIYDTATMLGRGLQRIRQLINESQVSAKYLDAQLIDYMRAAWEAVLIDVNNQADNPIVVRYDVAVVAGTEDYLLPPTIGELLMLSKIHNVTGLTEWEMADRSRWNPSGPGFTIEGNVLHFNPIPSEALTLRLVFIPTGEVELHSGTTTTHSSTTVTLAAGPTTGSLDRRPNAYVGCILRALSATWVGGPDLLQERVITAYNASTRVATVTPAFNPAPDVGTMTYEIVPFLWELLEMAVCFYTASMILSAEGATKVQQGIERKYFELIRAVKLRAVNMDNRIGDRFEHDTPENRRYAPFTTAYWG